MGMRFKKSKKIAPGVKLNVSNKSVGVSVGGKGVHHSVSSSGRKTTTVSAPGTGLSYVKTSGGGSRKGNPLKAQSGTVGCGTILLGFILFFLIVGVFSSGFSSGRKKAAEAAASSSSAASSSTVSAVSETSTPTPTEAPVETKVMYSQSSLNIRAAAARMPKSSARSRLATLLPLSVLKTVGLRSTTMGQRLTWQVIIFPIHSQPLLPPLHRLRHRPISRKLRYGFLIPERNIIPNQAAAICQIRIRSRYPMRRRKDTRLARNAIKK